MSQTFTAKEFIESITPDLKAAIEADLLEWTRQCRDLGQQAVQDASARVREYVEALANGEITQEQFKSLILDAAALIVAHGREMQAKTQERTRALAVKLVRLGGEIAERGLPVVLSML